MNYLLDTCVVSDFFKKLPITVKHFESVSPIQIHISAISVMEIEYGLTLNPDREKKIRPLWDILLRQIGILDFSEPCANATATIKAHLKTSGLPIGPYDILIAGTAIAHEMIVVTSNVGEFKRISGIMVEDWRKE